MALYGGTALIADMKGKGLQCVAEVGEAVQRAQSSPTVEALPTPTPSWLAGYGHQPLALGLIGMV